MGSQLPQIRGREGLQQPTTADLGLALFQKVSSKVQVMRQVHRSEPLQLKRFLNDLQVCPCHNAIDSRFDQYIPFLSQPK